jgi:hypothetical protein
MTYKLSTGVFVLRLMVSLHNDKTELWQKKKVLDPANLEPETFGTNQSNVTSFHCEVFSW